MIRFIITLTTLLLSIFVGAQVTETRTVGSFSSLKVSQGIHVFYTVSDQQSLKVETDSSEKMKFIKTEIEGETLRIYVDAQNVNIGNTETNSTKNSKKSISFRVLNVYLSAPALNQFKVNSSGSVTVQNPLKTNHLKVEASSSGDFKATVECQKASIDVSSSADVEATIQANEIEVSLSSSADATLSGTCHNLTVTASSSADCKASKLQTKTATIQASSSANVHLWATESLNAQASSSADIYYSGNPEKVQIKEGSSGSVTQNN